MKRAIFPGTFDPFTTGHASIIRRALTFMDEVVIGIGVNEKKRTLLSTDIRMQMISEYYKDDPRVAVEAYSDLTIDFARRVNAHFIIRGIRSVKDFEYEESIADINRRLAGIETILLFTEPELTNISSSVVRELMSYGKDISSFLPEGMTIPTENKTININESE
ncbi:MAG: pantetheine-phosphate adenylyltransferase [Bacteroidaceae bacterium]|nr:pantetheine-phosphate adenylyltransferase [Bacteroidaceae bacterium]